MRSKTTEGRAEPAGMTITDLMVLVLGSAIAFSLRRVALLNPGPVEGFEPSPDQAQWAIRFLIVVDFGLRCELVLALVALGRCWRWNRVPRPIEWLAILAAIVLTELIGAWESNPFHLNWSWLLWRGPFAAFVRTVSSESGHVVNVLLGASLGIGCLATIAAYRKRLPVRFKAILMVGAAYALLSGMASELDAATWDVVYDLMPEPRRKAIPDSFWDALGCVCGLPRAVLFGTTILAMVCKRGDRPSCPWITLAISIALIPYAFFDVSQRFVTWPYGTLHPVTLLATVYQPGLVLLLSLLALGCLRPIWNRWLGLGYDGTRPASSPSEA